MVEVEIGGLRALEQDLLTGVESVVHEVDGVGDERLESRDHRQVGRRDLVGIERELVVDLGQHTILLAQREVELLPEDLRIEEILDPYTDPQRLVGIGRTDAAPRGAELVLAEESLGHAIELAVIRHDQMRVPRHAQRARVDVLGLEHVDLGQQHRRLDDDAVADHWCDVGVEHSARDQLEREHVAADDDRVARVVPALVSHAERAFLGEVVGEATLALIAPLGSYDHRAGHGNPFFGRGNATAITFTRS